MGIKTLLLTSALVVALGPTRVLAQEEDSPPDEPLFAELLLLPSCEQTDAAADATWIPHITELLVELSRDCRERVPSTDRDACEVDRDQLVALLTGEPGTCRPDDATMTATAYYIMGDRLLAGGNFRQGELYLFRAQQVLEDDAAIVRRWTDAIGRQLRALALQRPLTDRYARDVLLLTTAALRFYPDDWDLRSRRAWARLAAGQARLEGEFDRCQGAIAEHDWDTAEAACDTVLAIEPGHEQAQQLLQLVAGKRAQGESLQGLLRWLGVIGMMGLGLVVFVLLQGDFFLAVGKPRLALAAYTYLATVLPAWRKPYLRIARIHQREGNLRDEQEILQRALAQWPRDPEVLRQRFEFTSRVGDVQGVRDTLLELNEATHLAPEQVVSLLEAQRSLGLVEEDLYDTLENIVGSNPATPLLPLLALAHSQRGRTDEEAWSVYKATIDLPDPRLRFFVTLARTEMEAGQAGKAIEYAERAVAEHPTPEAVDCLTDALLETDLEEHIIWTSPPAGGILYLYPALLKVAERRADLAPMIAERMRDFYELTTEPSVAVVTSAIADMLEGKDCREQLLAAADAVDESVPYLKAVEAAFEEYARRHPSDGFLWLALTGIHGKLGRHALAMLALQRAFEIPETRSFAARYALTLVQDLETYQVVELMAAALGLEARPVQQTRDGFVELIFAHPRRPLEGWWRELDHAHVRIYLQRAPTPEDVLDFRRDMGAHGRGGLAILVSAARPSAGTTELIMTSMIEQPNLHMLPLEERTLRDAVAEFRTHAALTQLRSQWLLGEDLFDKKDPVLDPAEFFGRGQVLRTLVRKVHRGEVFGLFGIRKMGKTSLAHRLRTHLSDSVVAMVDLQEVAAASCVALAQLLCERAVEDWKAKFPHIEAPDLQPIDPEDTAMTGLEANLRTLRAAILETTSITTLFFLVDEIEHMIPHELDHGAFHPGFEHYDTFFRLMRGLHQTDFRDVFGFAVVGADARLCLQGRWGGRDNPIFQYLSELYVGPLSSSETLEMVSTLGAGMGLSFTDTALATLYDLSGGHPMVCRQLCSETAKVAGDARPATIDSQTVRSATESYLTLKKGYFGEILSFYLNAGQRAILDAVAADEEGAITRSDLQQRTERQFGDVDAFDKELQNLEQYSLLHRRGDQYRFTMRLFRTYIRVRRLDIDA